MNAPDLADLAAQALRRARAAIHPRPHPADDQLTEAVAGALASKRARRRRRRGATATLGVIAATVIIWLAGRERPPAPVAGPAAPPAVELAAFGAVPVEAVLIDGAGRRQPIAGAAIGRGARVSTTATAPLAMKLWTGTVLRVLGDLDVVETGAVQQFELRRGRLDAQVAKLRRGQRFLVRAGPAEIEVRGTAFEVALGGECAGEPRTDLTVREGVVAVRAGGEERLVPAGQRWQSRCLADLPAVAAPRRRPARVAVSRAEAPSSLGEQNQLFIDAVHARKEGRPAEALRGLERLLQAHPSGPLTEAAMAERLTLLRDGDRAAAAVAARAYLSRFPDGFARAEAEALAAGAR
jgi:hypothetical protein